jgi:hypothetical protein
MTTSAQYVFSNSPLNFCEPIECRFQQLPEVQARALASGFVIVRMTVIPRGYRLTFQRAASATPGALPDLPDQTTNATIQLF